MYDIALILNRPNCTIMHLYWTDWTVLYCIYIKNRLNLLYCSGLKKWGVPYCNDKQTILYCTAPVRYNEQTEIVLYCTDKVYRLKFYCTALIRYTDWNCTVLHWSSIQTEIVLHCTDIMNKLNCTVLHWYNKQTELYCTDIMNRLKLYCTALI